MSKSKNILESEIDYFNAVGEDRNSADLVIVQEDKPKTRSHISSINFDEIVVTEYKYNGKTYFFDKCGCVVDVNGLLVGVKNKDKIHFVDDNIIMK